MSGSGFSRLTSVIGLSALLSACSSNLIYESHTVEKHSDAGAFTVAATMVDTWDNFAETLSPAFPLTETQALGAVVPRTTVTEKQMLDSLAVALQVAPPTSATSGTTTESLKANGTTETTGSETTTTGAGDASKASLLTAPTKSVAQQKGSKLPDDAGTALGLDPFLKYTAATALFQEVRLLNNAVRAAARRHRMVPYILRLQMNNVPFARHQPYDTYAMVSLFAREVCSDPNKDKNDDCSGKRDAASKTGWKDREAVVVPLLVTDNLESMLASRSSTVVRQFATAASILQGGFAAALGLTRKTEELNAVLSNDLNSLMTVGRPTNSSLYVRLGAMQEATARYAMVPRNYSITALVLVPEDRTPEDEVKPGDIEGIRITGSLTYRHAETGATLPREPSAARDKLVKQVVREVAGKEVNFENVDPAHLRAAIYVNDYNWFVENVSKLKDCDNKKNPIKIPADLWNALLERNVSTGFFGEFVHLPKPAAPHFPPPQSVFLFDDGTNGTKAQLQGGFGLSAEWLGASLIVPIAAGVPVTLPATDITIGNQGGNPLLVFPSIAAWGIKPVFAGGSATVVRNAQLQLHTVNRDRGYERNMQTVGGSGTYQNVLYRLTGQTDGVLVRLSKTVHSVTPDNNNKAAFRVYVEFLPGADGKLPDSVELIPDGGDLTTATGSAAGALTITLGKTVLTASDTVTLGFEGLAKNKSVKVRAVAKQGGKAVGAEPAAIQIDVN